MGKPDETSITTFECRSILDSIQNEYEQQQRGDSILRKLQEDLAELVAQRNILSKRKEFNEKYCILCCSAFNLLFKRKVFCQDCRFWICRSCSLWDNSAKQWQCKVCEKQKILDAESRAWICNRIKTNFGYFGAAKILQNFCRMRRISDSENDSGYGTTSDFVPLMKLLSSNSLNKDLKMTDVSSHDEECEDEEDDIGDEEELAEIHHSIETILEGLLGGTLDDASVDHLYPSSALYLNLFVGYHNKLVEVIRNLSKALQKALHNLPAENGITPTSAHAALKNVITLLVDECQELPPLQCSEQKESDLNIPVDFAEIFSSYDSLVAAAVINKVVEESQSKFKRSDCASLEESMKMHHENGKLADEFPSIKNENEDVYVNLCTGNSTGFDMPVECVQIEEIEEITQEFTDSEDDKLSSISKWSNSLQSIDEVGLPKHPDLDLLVGIDLMNDSPTPFPEFGCDLVDDSEKKDCPVTCHNTVITSWEENWLFRKKKRLPLYSNLKYQLLTYCDEPPCMLIPCPSESTDTIEQDELSSELSETHSAGSLEFSSENEDIKLQDDNQKLNVEVHNEAVSKSLKQNLSDTSPFELHKEISCESQQNEMCHVDDENETLEVEMSELLNETESFPLNESENYQINNSEGLSLNESESLLVNNSGRLLLNNIKSIPDASFHSSHEKKENLISSIDPVNNEEVFIATPPRPGTIAEREHKKWLNAVPLKNNPYSAENISKRSNYAKNTILKEPISSFEEFERKLSVTSETTENELNKVNCGPKSIDSELYKRDYYVNQGYENFEDGAYPLKKSAKHVYSVTDDFGAISEEALNSFEEKVYISSGKVFTLENHVKRLEREIKDLSPSSDLQSLQSFMPQNPPQDKNENKAPIVSNKSENEKVKKSRPCMKVHSLTARSLSREFRDLAKLNLPKPMNRTIPVPSQTCDDGTSERESLCSPESVQSSFSLTQADNGHGYTSDESNTSTSSIPRSKSRRHISRSILQRATYWERRAEQGLLSDASVSEEFPGIDINPE